MPGASNRQGLRLLRLPLIGVLTAGTLVLVFSSALAGITRDPAPALSVRYGGDSEALAEQAEDVLERNRSPEGLQAAERLASEALERSPLLPTAFEVLGAVADAKGESALSEARYGYAEKLSKRDLDVELWLAQSRVAASDWNGALVHFDRVMRVRPTSGRIVLPVLVASLEDPRLIEPLARRLTANAPWRDDFLLFAAKRADSPRHVSALFQRLDGPIPLAASMALIDRLSSAGSIELAVGHFERATGRKVEPGLRNGDFEQPYAVAPFDWNFGVERDSVVGRVPAPEGADGSALHIIWEEGDGRELLRQLLVLPPGRYRLSGTVYPVRLSRTSVPAWEIRCAERGKLLGVAQPEGGRGRGSQFSVDFEVGPDCHSQWVMLSAALGRIDSELEIYFDGLAIRPLGPRR